MKADRYTSTAQNLEHCGAWHSGMCPRVKAMEFNPDGTLRRVELWPLAGAGAGGR